MSRKGLAGYTLATLVTIFCFANTAFAADVGSKSGSLYVGGGISSVGIQYKTTIKASDGSEGNANGKANTVGAFIDAGYKISLNKFYIAPEIFFQLQPEVKTMASAGKMLGVNGPLYGGLVRLGYDFQNNFRVNIFGGVTNAERYSALLGDYNPTFQTTTKAFYGTYGLGLAYKINEKFEVKGDLSYIDLGSNGVNSVSLAPLGFPGYTGDFSSKYSMTQLKLGVTRYF